MFVQPPTSSNTLLQKLKKRKEKKKEISKETKDTLAANNVSMQANFSQQQPVSLPNEPNWNERTDKHGYIQIYPLTN